MEELIICVAPYPGEKQEEKFPGKMDVAEEVIRRRYERGLKNFFHVYKPMADSWDFINNAGSHGPRTIAVKQIDQHEVVYDAPLWDYIKGQADG